MLLSFSLKSFGEEMLQPPSDHPKIRARTEQQRGGRVRSVCMFVPLSAFRSVAALIGEWAAWSGDGMRQRQPMWCAILLSHRPSINPARRRCLYDSAVFCRSNTCNVHMCLFAENFVCWCLDKSIESLPPPTSIGGCGGAGGGSAAPLKDSCPSPQSSRPQCHFSTAQLTSSLRHAEWIKGDTMRHLM